MWNFYDLFDKYIKQIFTLSQNIRKYSRFKLKLNRPSVYFHLNIEIANNKYNNTPQKNVHILNQY